MPLLAKKQSNQNTKHPEKPTLPPQRSYIHFLPFFTASIRPVLRRNLIVRLWSALKYRVIITTAMVGCFYGTSTSQSRLSRRPALLLLATPCAALGSSLLFGTSSVLTIPPLRGHIPYSALRSATDDEGSGMGIWRFESGSPPPRQQSTDGGIGNGRDEDGGLLVLADPCRGPEFLLTAIDPVLHLTRAT